MAEPSQYASTGGDELDLTDAGAVIETIHQAAELNRSAEHRRGGIAELPTAGRLTITGDLHDHGPNYRKILKLAELDHGSDRYLILHELIHGPLVNGLDLSVRMLARVCDLKTRFPEQVLLMQSNHELAQLAGEGILKDGVSVVEAFDAGIDHLYPDDAEAVRAAVEDYVRSLLLGVRCGNGVFCSHSLPAPKKIERFDKTVIERTPTDYDLAVNGAAHLMVWGRHHNQKIADELAEAFGVSVFVLGHQPAEMGHDTETDKILILASDHNHGVALPIDLAQPYDLESLEQLIMPLAAISA